MDAGKSRVLAVLTSAMAFLCGCETRDAVRYEGVYHGAGDAAAANSVMQMVDPWPRGVEDTNLSVPADLDQYKRQAGEGEAEPSTTQ